MASKSAVGASQTECITLDDAPQLEPTLRLTLKQKSLWKRMKDSAAKGLNPKQLLELINSEERKIHKDVDKRGHITEEEADFLNKSTREKLEKVLDEFKENCLKHIEIHPNDTAEEVKFKLHFSEQLISWLTELFTWLLKKIDEIFVWRKEKPPQWCMDQTEKLFKHLWDLLN